MPIVIGVCGPSGSGKTTLIERLLPRLASRGLTVGVIKHTHHDVSLDQPGKDSWRFWQAGAETVAVASPGELMLRQRREASLSEALAHLPSALDYLIVEGFSRQHGGAGDEVSLRLELQGQHVIVNGRAIHRDDLDAVEEVVLTC